MCLYVIGAIEIFPQNGGAFRDEGPSCFSSLTRRNRRPSIIDFPISHLYVWISCCFPRPILTPSNNALQNYEWRATKLSVQTLKLTLIGTWHVLLWRQTICGEFSLPVMAAGDAILQRNDRKNPLICLFQRKVGLDFWAIPHTESITCRRVEVISVCVSSCPNLFLTK